MSASDKCSIIILKPDLIDQKLEEVLAESIAGQGLAIEECGSILMDLDFIRELYQWPVINFPFELHDYLCREPLRVWLAKGAGAVSKLLKIKADLRAAYSKSKLYTLIHCPDSVDDFKREYQLIMAKIKEET